MVGMRMVVVCLFIFLKIIQNIIGNYTIEQLINILDDNVTANGLYSWDSKSKKCRIK